MTQAESVSSSGFPPAQAGIMAAAVAPGPADPDLERMTDRAGQAAGFLKSLAHKQRILILCHLAEGEKSVSELCRLLGTRQAALSQQLARLRRDRLVSTRREGKAIYYSLGNDRAEAMIGLLYRLFCEAD